MITFKDTNQKKNTYCKNKKSLNYNKNTLKINNLYKIINHLKKEKI